MKIPYTCLWKYAAVATASLIASGVTAQSASAIQFFANDKSGFDSAIGSLGNDFTVDFESGSLSTFSDANSSQTVDISSGANNTLTIGGEAFPSSGGTSPNSGSNQLQVGITQNQTETITFSFANPTRYFGVYIGDQFDVTGTSSYELATNTGGTFYSASDLESDNAVPRLASGNNGTGDITTDTPSGLDAVTYTAGNGEYTFFGVVDETNPFTSVTLTTSSFEASGGGGGADNFVMDDVIVAVPFEVETGAGLVLLGGYFGWRHFRRRKQAPC